jgi:TetR/AcrR family transcriptional regulator, transcriptional repressor for nem operon
MARYSADHKAQTHRRIVSRAGVQLRQRGLHGVSVAELMAEAGLTHGGFYAHFPSRDALVAAACRDMLARTAARLNAAADAVSPLESRRALIEAYLTAAHRDAPGRGCAVAALGPEVARAAPEVRQALADGIRELIDVVAECTPAATYDQARRDAIATMATLVGTLVLARAAGEAPLSDEILEAGRNAVLD